MHSAEEVAQVASDVLESLDDLYDQCISVAQLRRMLTACAIAVRGTTLGPAIEDAAQALSGIAERGLPESDNNAAALIATDDLRKLAGSYWVPPTP